MTKPRVETYDFEFAHGFAPRGEGCWAFFPEGSDDVQSAVFFNGKFGDARKKAQAWAVEHGFRFVRVGS